MKKYLLLILLFVVCVICMTMDISFLTKVLVVIGCAVGIFEIAQIPAEQFNKKKDEDK